MCIVSPSTSNSVSSSLRKSSLFKAFNWFFDFKFLPGFWRSKFGMSMIALNATSCKGELCFQEYINLAVSSIYWFQDILYGKQKIFFLQKILYRRLYLTSSQIELLCISSVQSWGDLVLAIFKYCVFYEWIILDYLSSRVGWVQFFWWRFYPDCDLYFLLQISQRFTISVFLVGMFSVCDNGKTRIPSDDSSCPNGRTMSY